ncbi:hypothetical protein ACFLZZ_00615 [Nanoarchaeota archaeon]
MAEKDKIFEEKLVHDGIFDLKNTYNFLYTLLTDDEFSMEENSYKEKNAGTSKEIEIAWTAKKKISDYFRFLVKISWRVLGMQTVEVTKDGQKVKMNKGLLEIKIAGFLERDYENKWESSALYKFLRGVYDQFVVAKTIKGYEGKLGEEMSAAINQLKSFLVLEAKR